MPLFLDDFLLLDGARRWWAGDPSLPLDPLGLPDLFVFLEGDPSADLSSAAGPLVPWWTDPGTRLAFWRPVSAALVLLDAKIGGGVPWVMHLGNVLWYVAFAAAWAWALQALLPEPRQRRLAPLAAAIFAVDDAHWLPVVWVANRNALVAGLFTALALGLRARGRAGWRPGSPIALGCAALALAAGEIGASGLALLLAWELAGPRPSARWAGALVALGAAWLGAWILGGYGVYRSALYLDPLREPATLAAAAPGRLLALVGGALLPVPADGWLAGGWAQAGLIAQGLLAVALVLVALRPLRARFGAPVVQAAASGFAALIPAVATFPLNRMTLIPSLGGSVLLAAAMLALWDLRYQPTPSRWSAAAGKAGFGLALIHLLGPSGGWLPGTWTAAQGAATIHDAVQALPEGVEDMHVVLLSGSDPNISLYLPHQRLAVGAPAPGRWTPLSMVPGDLTVQRTADDRLLLTLADGAPAPLDVPFVRLLRPTGSRFTPGEAVRRPGVEVRPRDAEARAVEVRFDQPLSGGRVVLLAWDPDGLRRIEPPPLGEAVEVRWAPGPSGQ